MLAALHALADCRTPLGWRGKRLERGWRVGHLLAGADSSGAPARRNTHSLIRRASRRAGSPDIPADDPQRTGISQLVLQEDDNCFF